MIRWFCMLGTLYFRLSVWGDNKLQLVQLYCSHRKYQRCSCPARKQRSASGTFWTGFGMTRNVSGLQSLPGMPQRGRACPGWLFLYSTSSGGQHSSSPSQPWRPFFAGWQRSSTSWCLPACQSTQLPQAPHVLTAPRPHSPKNSPRGSSYTSTPCTPWQGKPPIHI